MLYSIMILAAAFSEIFNSATVSNDASRAMDIEPPKICRAASSSNLMWTRVVIIDPSQPEICAAENQAGQRCAGRVML